MMEEYMKADFNEEQREGFGIYVNSTERYVGNWKEDK